MLHKGYMRPASSVHHKRCNMCWRDQHTQARNGRTMLMSLVPAVQPEQSCSVPCILYSHPDEAGHAEILSHLSPLMSVTSGLAASG